MRIKPFQSIRDIATMTRQELEENCTRYVKSHYLGDHLHLCKVLTKYKLYLDTRDVGIAPNILMDGYWESWITKFIAQKVEPGFTCIDAGANFGYYSLVLAELAGKEGKTISIEPNDYLCKLLGFSRAVNEPHFEIVQKALSDKEGSATLSIPAHFWGGGTIRTEKVDDEILSQQVTMQTLDSIAQEFSLEKIDFIKMDCEGVEPLIFQGMQRIMAQPTPLKLVMEYSPFMYHDAQAFTEYLFNHFELGQITGDANVHPYTKEDSGHLLNLNDHIDLYLERRR